VKNGLKSSQFLADLTNSAWRILADFYIRSGGFEKKSSGNAAALKLFFTRSKQLISSSQDVRPRQR
jgi:hypothetical protein